MQKSELAKRILIILHSYPSVGVVLSGGAAGDLSMPAMINRYPARQNIGAMTILRVEKMSGLKDCAILLEPDIRI